MKFRLKASEPCSPRLPSSQLQTPALLEGFSSNLPRGLPPRSAAPGRLPGNQTRPAPWQRPDFRSCALELLKGRSVWRNMAASRLPPATLTLKQFMRRQQVLLLYRRILQALRQVPNESDRKYLKDWAREEFKRNKSATEEDTIRMMITQGNMQLKELEKTLALAKS